MGVGIIFLLILILIIWSWVAKVRKLKQKKINEAEKRDDFEEAKRLKNMDDEDISNEFEDEL